jgi:hypothetical protein
MNMGNGDTDTAGLLGDRHLMHTLRRIAAAAPPAPGDADQVARALLTWRTVDADLASLLGSESSGQPPPDAVPAGACHASASAR